MRKPLWSETRSESVLVMQVSGKLELAAGRAIGSPLAVRR